MRKLGNSPGGRQSNCGEVRSGPGLEVTEDGIARAFTARTGGKFLYDHGAGKWFIWANDRWLLDATGQALELIRQITRGASDRLKEPEQARVRRAQFFAGAERIARTDPAHTVRQEEWDTDPFLLGCPRATVDLRSGASRRPESRDRITHQTAVAPIDTPVCPRWLTFLDEATGGDAGMIRLLRQWCGYALTGDTREQALVFLYGPGGNGKSVFVNTLTGIMGDYAVTAAMDTFTASFGQKHPTDLAMLKGARLVTASETEEKGVWAKFRIKQLTGGDPITARFMWRDFFTYVPQFKLTIVGNHKPSLNHVDDAVRRRFNIVPFERQPGSPDPELEAKLREEWPGILRWMIGGGIDWQENGLIRPESVTAATEEYFSDQDLVGQWLNERCNVDRGNSHRYETSADLYSSYAEFARGVGESPGTQKALGDKLKARGLVRLQKKIGGQNFKVWTGVSLLRKASNET